MSIAMWCDAGNHAFKSGEPGSQSMTGTVIRPDGVPTQAKMDVCADHANMTSVPKELGRLPEEPWGDRPTKPLAYGSD